MSENMEIYEASRTVPPEALKAIQGGRLKGMSDINPMWRIKKLTELYGPCGIGWKIEVTDKRLEQGSGIEIVCFVDINLYVKHDSEWSAPIPGMGGSSFVTQEKNGPYTSDECFKMAYTDAISVACKSLGFAADVYYANDRTKYSSKGDEGALIGHKEKQQDIPPPTLKAKYLEFRGSSDGFEDWVKNQQSKGHNFKQMQEILAQGLLKKAELLKQEAK